LTTACELSAGHTVAESDLLLAFTQDADKETAECLKRLGIDVAQLRAILQGEEPGREPGGVPVAPPPNLGLGKSAQEPLGYALQEAYRMGYASIETPHLVIGLIKVRDGCTARALQQQRFDPKRVRDAIRSAMQPAGQAITKPLELRPESLSSRTRQILDLAATEARTASATEIEECHLLLGFLKVSGSSTAEFLRQMGIDLEAMLAFAQGGPQAKSTGTPLLDRLGRDLTKEAREGRLKPVIGRRREMGRIAQIMARTDKNSPLLIGDAGVGKTAIVEGLAQRIADGQVPEHLRDKRIIELPIASLVAGTKYRGDLEERLQQFIREAQQPDVILFLDEIHTLVGAGRAEGSLLDVGNILKSALARGEVRCIGATTVTEFRRSIEKDEALERRFQPIQVAEPSQDETKEILRQLRPRYEAHHHVQLSDEALGAAVGLSVAYLPDRRLPDKACDLIDEACARARIGSASQWPGQVGLPPAEGVVIGAEDVARVVAEWTGIPVARLTETEQAKLLKLEDLLRQRIVGQDEAIAAVAQAIRLARSGLKRPNRPVGVFFFIGPSGVGKTELAKALAEVLFGSEQDLLRLDMSEYVEQHSVSKLIGAPPGYVGYEEDGQLTGALRRKPYCVVLLDEIDKAHPRVLDLFLQLFDDGRLTDSQGRLADGRNAIYIMTSNIPGALLDKKAPMGFGRQASAEGSAREELIAEFRKLYRPEFVNRLDEIVVFQRLQPDHVAQIARLQIDRLVAQVREQHGIELVVEESALALICEQGYTEEYGVRPLQRTIDRLLAKPLSVLFLEGRRGTFVARALQDRVAITAQEGPEPEKPSQESQADGLVNGE
jgi:ATP-dependent Clp protease ATP-binding subunit ClpC